MDGGGSSVISSSLESLPGNRRPLSFSSRSQEPSSFLYHSYPASKPFINSDYLRSPSEPISSFPECNRDAVITALKNLQEKIHSLELERCEAEGHLNTLASETMNYRKIIDREKGHKAATENLVYTHTQDLENQLSAVETRCNLLENQLKYMRKMVHTEDRSKEEAQHKTSLLERLRQNCPHMGSAQVSLEKISDLEKGQIKLGATQALAENKIKELEEQLKEESHQRMMLQKSAAKLEMLTKANRYFDEAGSKTRTVRKNAKKKKSTLASKKSSAHQTKPQSHFRLNLAEIPFVAGTSTSKSHAVGANVQSVLALMKSHNVALCSAVNEQNKMCASSELSCGASDLTDLLIRLQEEFSQLSWEHQSLSNRRMEAVSTREKELLEDELDAVVDRMEVKGKQITKLRKQLHKKEMDISGKCKRWSKSATRSRVGVAQPITVTKTRAVSPLVVQKTEPTNNSLKLLQDMKKLQATLRQDDLSWV